MWRGACPVPSVRSHRDARALASRALPMMMMMMIMMMLMMMMMMMMMFVVVRAFAALWRWRGAAVWCGALQVSARAQRARGLRAGRATGDLARAHYELRAFVSGEGKKEGGGLGVAAGGFEPATPI